VLVHHGLLEPEPEHAAPGSAAAYATTSTRTSHT
jgi:hypothetical protein